MKPLNVKQARKMLQDKGYYLIRDKGSHEIWGKQYGGIIALATNHGKEISPGVTRQLMKFLGA